ncbi:hypothetical protein, partial [Burkholderia sp. SIMBA_051]|uniref:hypothetical protein n=1 Tax=Burkholderia sp. SIMBA_051 TaxID=3085792 RepID=UPI003978D5BC
TLKGRQEFPDSCLIVNCQRRTDLRKDPTDYVIKCIQLPPYVSLRRFNILNKREDVVDRLETILGVVLQRSGDDRV